MRYSKRRKLTYEQATALSDSELDACIDADSRLPVEARNYDLACAWADRNPIKFTEVPIPKEEDLNQ